MTVFALFIGACAGCGYFRQVHTSDCACSAQALVECSDEYSSAEKRCRPMVATLLRTLRRRLGKMFVMNSLPHASKRDNAFDMLLRFIGKRINPM
jgi:hypothetical protein